MMGMVVAPQAMASEIGANVLATGGNAVDAAVAVAFVQGVLDPVNCGIGGFGCMVVYGNDGSCRTLSFHATAGSRVEEGMWEGLIEDEYRGSGGDGFRLRGFVNSVGYQSIATPGTVAGMASALREFGSRSWSSVIEAAVPLALEGFRITPKARLLFRRSSSGGMQHPAIRGTSTPAARAIFTKDGHNVWEDGDLLVQREHGRTLLRIAEFGAEEMYRGAVAERIAADIGLHGGFVTSEDLASYEPKWEDPLVGQYRGYSVLVSPLPSCGVLLLEMLYLAERFDLGRMEHNGGQYLDVLARIMRWVFSDRSRYLGDPAGLRLSIDELLARGRMDRAQQAIESGERIVVPRWRPAESGTSHVSVADRWGNLVSLTHSLGACSGVVTEGLGFLYNNAMDCFNPIPGTPNSIVPGRARVTGMTPAVLSAGDGRRIVIGAPGGAMITNSVFQVINNIIDFGMSATEAVSAPRIDCQGEDVEVEARLPERVCGELVARGHSVVRSVASYWTHPLVQVIIVDAARKRVDGGSDPRGEGMPVRESRV